MAQAGPAYQFSKGTEVLWAGETLLCFGLFFTLLVGGLGQSGVSAAHHAAAYALTLGVTALSVGIYRIEVRRHTAKLLSRTVVAAVLSLPSVCLIGYLLPIDPPDDYSTSAHRAAALLLAQAGAIVIVRVVFGLILQSPVFIRRVLVLGASPATAWIRGEGNRTYDVQPLWAAFERIAPVTLEGIWAVVVDARSHAELPPGLASACRRRRIRVLRDSTFLETCLRRMDLSTVTSATLAWHRAAPDAGDWTRAFDIGGALLLMVAVLPVVLLTIMAIKLEDGGPVLYRQNRIGLRGREFTLFKFRSMRVDAEADGPVWAQQRDPRITRVGAFIRRVRIDELPQLINILRGEMSIVGPRPERPHFVAQLCAAIPCYGDRSRVKPGLTGWAQVNYPYGASIEDARAKLSYDLYYVKHRSTLLNLMTLFATIRVVMFQEGSR